MHKHVCACLISTAMIASATARADDHARKIEVGNSIVNGELLKPFENSWTMQVTRKDGTVNHDAGLWRDRLELIDIKGKTYGVRFQDATFKNKDGVVVGTTHTVNVFDRATMAPVTRSFERHMVGKEGSSVNIAFEPHKMKLETTADGKTEKKDFRVEPAFDFDGGLYALLWSAFPLKQGFTATLPSYGEDAHPEKVSWYTFKVSGSEQIDAGHAGKIECWVVEGESGSGPLKYWLSAAPPYIIRLQFDQAGTGATWLLKMT